MHSHNVKNHFHVCTLNWFVCLTMCVCVRERVCVCVFGEREMEREREKIGEILNMFLGDFRMILHSLSSLSLSFIRRQKLFPHPNFVVVVTKAADILLNLKTN